jgi:hypothetical protein
MDYLQRSSHVPRRPGSVQDVCRADLPRKGRYLTLKPGFEA